MQLDDKFLDQIYSVVAEIPHGKVSTYGDIAKFSGCDNNSRLVAKAISGAYGINIPCHRVVNSDGRLAPGWDEQRDLLINEGIEFKVNNNVDLKKYRWEGE